MADKEPRKRKKRKENQKRDDTDELPQQKDKGQTDRSSSEERILDLIHEPSIFAKSVFFILFSLLIVAVGIIFFTLHGVQRDSWELSRDSGAEAESSEPHELHSMSYEEMSVPFDQKQTIEEESYDVEPSDGQDVGEDEQIEPSATIDPSEMHPWAEHIPEEKPEEQNILNQLYEALEEEFLQDENEDTVAEETYDDDGFMEDSLLQVDSDPDGQQEEPSMLSSDSFEVIIEDVEIPQPQQTLLDLPSDETAEVEGQVSQTLSQPLESSMHDETPLSQQEVPELKEIDIGAAVEKSERDTEVREPEYINDDVADRVESALTEPENLEPEQKSAASEEVPLPKEAIEYSVSEEFNIIDWPDDDNLEKPITQQPEGDPSKPKGNDVFEEQLVESSVEDLIDITNTVQHESVNDSPDNGNNDDNAEDIMYYESAEAEGIAEDSNEPFSVQDSETDEQQAEEYGLPYERSDVTNEYDFLFKEDIDEADRIVEKEPEDSDFYFWQF